MHIGRTYDKVIRLLRTENLPFQSSEIFNWIAEAIDYFLSAYPLYVVRETATVSNPSTFTMTFSANTIKLLRVEMRHSTLPYGGIHLMDKDTHFGYGYSLDRDNNYQLILRPKFNPINGSEFVAYTQKTLPSADKNTILSQTLPSNLVLSYLPTHLEDLVSYRVAGEIFNTWYGEEGNYGDKFIQMAEDMASKMATHMTHNEKGVVQQRA